MIPDDFVIAARVPDKLQPQEFGLWSIRRDSISAMADDWARIRFLHDIGFRSYTILYKMTLATLHKKDGEVVMEDSARELRRHLPIWLHARGRILVTGLGLGCVVRGLLANSDVEHITVIEIDAGILRVVGPEFEHNSRVRLIHGDALSVSLERERFDYAWHDLWTDGERHLQLLHADLIRRFHGQVQIQGAWQFPKMFKRIMPAWFLR